MDKERCPFCDAIWKEPLCMCGAYTADVDNPNKTFRQIHGQTQNQFNRR